MAEQHPSDHEGIYHIRVQGHLDERWADWFEGFVMSARENGETLLSGRVTDQAALHGALGKIRGLDLPLLLVTQTECPCTKTNCSRRGQCEECASYHAAKGRLPYCFRPKTKWDKQCAALIEVKGKTEIEEKGNNVPRCMDCALRRRAEAKPESLLGRVWHWHLRWCPGWKAYQAYLAEQA